MSSLYGSFPSRRMRRMRTDSFSRKLVQENSLTPSNLIFPVFVLDERDSQQEIPSMPGISRLGLNPLLKLAEESLQLGIPALALFPVIEPQKKSLDAAEAYNPNGLIPRYVHELKKRFPELGIITDIALDPYTSHGQDGLVDDKGQILNDATVAILKRQSLCHAEAGSDIVAPSDMMDGRIGAIRQSLDSHAKTNTKILSYAAKYASAFYSPFRDALGTNMTLSNGNKMTYQMDPSNSDESIAEVSLDISEGADIIMIKPGMFYLDIIYRLKSKFTIPIFAYQVSGEYAMLKAAFQNKSLEEKPCVMESLMCFKRAGCNAVLSYYALDVARWLQKNT